MNPKFKSAEIQVIDDETREVEFIASDESVDRYGDIIRADGWDLRHFKKNPVLLFGHDSHSPPIGTVPKIIKDGTKLVARARFLPQGVYDFADTVWRIVKAGALRAVSVGFMPTEEPKMIRDAKNDIITGFEYTQQELLELSVVPVPANPHALALGRSLNLNPEYVKRVFVQPSASAFLAARRREIDLIRLRASGK